MHILFFDSCALPTGHCLGWINHVIKNDKMGIAIIITVIGRIKGNLKCFIGMPVAVICAVH